VSNIDVALIAPRVALSPVLLLLCCALARAQEAPSATPRRYRAVRVDGMTTIRELQTTFGADGFQAILHLNRLDLAHVRDGGTLIVPDGPASMAELSPFPVAIGQDDWMPPRLLVVSRRIQAFAAYQAGALVRWGATSTGRRETPTPAGLFATNWRSKLRRSSDNAEWLLPWYVNFINQSGVSFHQFALPGYPASHACARLTTDDAKWIYDWVELWELDATRRKVEVYGTPGARLRRLRLRQARPMDAARRRSASHRHSARRGPRRAGATQRDTGCTEKVKDPHPWNWQLETGN
jgi:hypothetical protein